MIKLYDVKWRIDTAGPSPHKNERTEVFFFGCKRAKEGNPCKGCFNSPLWNDDKVEFTHDPKEVAATINKFAPNKYVTIGGGEPTDQLDDLISLCRELKLYGFHVMVYTWKSLQDIMNNDHPEKAQFKELLRHIDVLVDGEFRQEEVMYDETFGDGLINSIGSGNQIVWDVKQYNDCFIPSEAIGGHCFWQIVNCAPFVKGMAMRDLAGLMVRETDNELLYITKQDDAPDARVNVQRGGE